MRDDRDMDAEFYLGAPKNERERERSAHASHNEDPGSDRAGEDDVATSPPAGLAELEKITDASLQYGIVEEADDDLGEGLYARRAA